ncbi:MAG TPA: 50S ribosomal protein L9 [Candidatus Latescibacteria bacterium]|nr:50S ribosomal protein L9 [Candidatus Latescibacterota bacterium]
MKVILMEDVEGLGRAGEVVQVASGYARNYLIPRNMALIATSKNLKVFKEEQKKRISRRNRARRDAQAMAEELNQLSLTVEVPVGEEDRMFGAVTSQTIAQLLKEKGFGVDRRKIVLDEPIQALGVYTVPIRLMPDIEAKVKVWVVKE